MTISLFMATPQRFVWRITLDLLQLLNYYYTFLQLRIISYPTKHNTSHTKASVKDIWRIWRKAITCHQLISCDSEEQKNIWMVLCPEVTLNERWGTRHITNNNYYFICGRRPINIQINVCERGRTRCTHYKMVESHDSQ